MYFNNILILHTLPIFLSVCLFTAKLSKNAQMAKKVHLSHLKDAQLSVEMFIDCFDCEKLHDLSIRIIGPLEKLER